MTDDRRVINRIEGSECERERSPNVPRKLCTGEPVWRRPSFISFSNPFHSFTHTRIHSSLLFHRFPSHFSATFVSARPTLSLYPDLLHSPLFTIHVYSFPVSLVFVMFTCMRLAGLTLTTTFFLTISC